MNNKEINRHLRAYEATRQEWINILVNDPGRSQAAEYVIKINATMEFLRGLWNWSDATVEMEVVR